MGIHSMDLQQRAAIELLEQGLPPEQAQYISTLQQVLADRILTAEERDEVVASAQAAGLTTEVRRHLHGEFLKHAALAALANGPITAMARGDLLTVARLLGLKPGAVEVAIIQAEQDADRIAELLLGMTESTFAITKPSSLGRIISPLKAGWGAVESIATILMSRPELPCVTCDKRTSHAIQLGGTFPVQQWGRILWQAKTLSIPGFAINAAVLAIADRHLMLQTGKTLVPIFRCSTCNNECDRWQVARTLLNLSRSTPTQ